MKTKDMKSVVEFYIPLSWCESLLSHKRLIECEEKGVKLPR